MDGDPVPLPVVLAELRALDYAREKQQIAECRSLAESKTLSSKFGGLSSTYAASVTPARPSMRWRSDFTSAQYDARASCSRASRRREEFVRAT